MVASVSAHPSAYVRMAIMEPNAKKGTVRNINLLASHIRGVSSEKFRKPLRKLVAF